MTSKSLDLIDICVNVTNGQFKVDQAAMLARAERHGVAGMLFTACDLQSARDSLPLCDGRKRLCTAGIHPHDAKDAVGDWASQLTELARHPMVAAIGECGLDFNRSFSPHEIQLDVFITQIDIAKATQKPLFVHDRDSGGAVLASLAEQQPLPPTVVHCFTGTQSELDDYIAEDFYIGITGWLTDARRGSALREMIKDVPLDRLLVETDAPFLRPKNAPMDFHTTHGVARRRNEPALLSCVVECLAQLRDEPIEVIANATTRNARKLFGFA